MQNAGCMRASAEEMRLRGFFSSMALRRSMAGVRGLERRYKSTQNRDSCHNYMPYIEDIMDYTVLNVLDLKGVIIY